MGGSKYSKKNKPHIDVAQGYIDFLRNTLNRDPIMISHNRGGSLRPSIRRLACLNRTRNDHKQEISDILVFDVLDLMEYVHNIDKLTQRQPYLALGCCKDHYEELRKDLVNATFEYNTGIGVEVQSFNSSLIDAGSRGSFLTAAQKDWDIARIVLRAYKKWCGQLSYM